MARSRLNCALLVSVLLVAACGGGEDTDTSDQTNAPSAISGMPEDESLDSEQADTKLDAEQRPSPEPETMPEPVQVWLGNRFDWCAGVQAVWDSHDHAQAVLAAAEARYRDALVAFEAATDELDRAEAREVLDAAQVDHDQASGAYQRAMAEVRQQLDDARRIQGDETERIAHQRAWLALVAADAEIATLAEIMASQAELNEVAAQLRHAVAQAVAALQDAEEGLQEARVEVEVESLMTAESRVGVHDAALAAAQAAAELQQFEAQLADMEAAGASSEEQQQARQQLEAKREELERLEGRFAEQRGQLDDGRVVAAQERMRGAEAGLGTATAMLRDAEAEAEEYRQQMPEPEPALQEALEGIITAGSDAYSAFKLSLRESCEP